MRFKMPCIELVILLQYAALVRFSDFEKLSVSVRDRVKSTVRNLEKYWSLALIRTWVNPAGDRNYWRTLVSAALNLRVP